MIDSKETHPEVDPTSTTPEIAEQEFFDPWEEEFRKTLRNGEKIFEF
ncbi:hypothetical protein [Rhizobium tubonense]|nr:hypothetical protein [Rhizobium tubonense]